MPAAVVGGVIAGAGAIGGAALSSKAQKKAAKTAANAQLDATAQNNALARERDAKNEAALAPWQQRGNTAGNAVNALLGIGFGSGAIPQPANNNALLPQPANNNALMPQPYNAQAGRFARPFGFAEPYSYDPTDSFVSTQATDIRPAQAQHGNPAAQYQNAFDNYRNSTGYQFRVGEGMRALDNSYASRGVGKSGAAAKAALNYGQNIASGEFGNYLNALMNVSNSGLSAANAQAGVGTNMVNAITNNNNAAAGAIGNNALAAGNANAQMWGAVGNSIGNLGGLFGSSFGNNSLNSASQRLIASNPGIF